MAMGIMESGLLNGGGYMPFAAGIQADKTLINDGILNTNSLSKFESLLKEDAGRHINVDKNSELYEQCLELETFLIKTLITGMRNTVEKAGLIEEGFAGKMYEDMLYDEYARDFTRNANFGLAEMAYIELTGQRGKLLAG
ncbi:MAG: rod-binding protein [Treponema sp.]|jgi:Rod binding domain-containing protein|nr:rod-binding protein [Treponema sp.]